jgi:hypothetical protein
MAVDRFASQSSGVISAIARSSQDFIFRICALQRVGFKRFVVRLSQVDEVRDGWPGDGRKWAAVDTND